MKSLNCVAVFCLLLVCVALPPLTFAGADGTIILRHPFPERFLGTRIPDSFLPLVTADGPGTRGTSDDEQRLADLGYKQELSRSWSAFSNFASSLRKTSSTLPTGPLRCLAMMISAMFCLTLSFSYWSGR